MRYFEFKLDDLCKAHNVPKGFFSCGKEIINVQLGNDISKDWDYSKGKAVIVAIMNDEVCKIPAKESFGKDDNDVLDERFFDIVNKILIGDYWAFNKVFHYYVCKANFKPVSISEIKPFKGKGCNRDWFVQKLIEAKQIPQIKIFDPLQERQVAQAYQRYVATGKEMLLMDIVSHALASCLKDALILKHHKYFQDNFEVGADGFIRI